MSEISIIAGETIDMSFGPVTQPISGAPVDLRLAGTRIHFIAKRSKDDADGAAEFDKVYQPGVTENQGINVPVAGFNNNGTVVIAASETRDITEALNLYFELILFEPSQRVTRLDSGRIKVGKPVLQAAP
jgi:hypothetical protein